MLNSRASSLHVRLFSQKVSDFVAKSLRFKGHFSSHVDANWRTAPCEIGALAAEGPPNLRPSPDAYVVNSDVDGSP
jgi:hypothetical protein